MLAIAQSNSTYHYLNWVPSEQGPLVTHYGSIQKELPDLDREEQHYFDIIEGKISRSQSSDSGFSLVGSPDVWNRYCMDIPPPEYNELGAMLGKGHVKVKGKMSDMQGNFMFVRRFLELWREDRREPQQEHNK